MTLGTLGNSRHGDGRIWPVAHTNRSTELPPPATGRARSPGRGRLFLIAAFCLLGALFVSYVVWLTSRANFTYSMLWNGWVPDGFEFVVALLCIARGFVRRPGRAAALALGFGLMSWCFGDTVWTASATVGSSNLTTELSAGFWLGFYPLAFLAVILMLRGKLRLLAAPGWLDGAVAALGTASVCAAFAFNGLEYAVGRDALTRATNIAYPMGDVLLLAMVVGGTAMLSRRSTLPWVVFGGACILNCIGDTYNLFEPLGGQLRVDAIFHTFAWPLAGLVMTIGVWLRPRPIDLFARQNSTGFVLPALAAASGLVVLVAGTIDDVTRIALDLAVGSLIAAGIRLVWSARGLQSLTEHRHRQSMTDELTDLGNRRYLFEVCNRFFRDQDDAHAERHSLALLFIDLDHFKEINDSFGHLAGDALLRQLGPRLTAQLREGDVLVRFGGDEFGVLLIDAGEHYAADVAQRLTTCLEAPFDLEGVSATISSSIGIATAPTDATDLDGLLECADVAMYRCKLSGSSFAFYDQHLDGANQWRLGEELRSAVERHQFVLHYQPQLDLATDTVCGLEALVRWQHPTLGLLAPLSFLPLAEQAGLMPALTAMLLDDALAQRSNWCRDGRELTVSVNISATNLLDKGFAELVRNLLERHRCPAQSLALEITETSVIANFERSKLVVQELADIGVILSVDDFGAGFTSLSYLSSLAVRELKLDCKLVTGIVADNRSRDRELVRSTIELGHALGLRVVAEGVEDEATLGLLRQLHCDVAQGYFISRPTAPEKVNLDLALRQAVVSSS